MGSEDDVCWENMECKDADLISQIIGVFDEQEEDFERACIDIVELEDEEEMTGVRPDSPVLGGGLKYFDSSSSQSSPTDHSPSPYSLLFNSGANLTGDRPSSQLIRPHGHPTFFRCSTLSATSDESSTAMNDATQDLNYSYSSFARPKRTNSSVDHSIFYNSDSLHSSTVTPFDIDPSIFPDPYPSHPWSSPMPALSSGSSNSARSSAYTTSANSIIRNSDDLGHVDVHVSDGLHGEGIGHGVGITADEPVELMYEPVTTRAPILTKSNSDASARWSNHSSAFSSRPRAGSAPKMPRSKISQEDVWQRGIHRRDDSNSMTDDETEDDDDEKFEQEVLSFETKPKVAAGRTAAAVIADEGRGLIVNGERLPVQRIPLVPGATHLLLSSSTTPNSLPPFLLTKLPTLSSSLLALDLSANFLMSLPASLATLRVLEELNVSSNPLRALPSFLSSLQSSLRVLIADSAGLSTLPVELACMKRLNVLSLRKNKLHGVPDCVAGMDALEDLRLEGNTFLGPWKSLTDPLLNIWGSPIPPVQPLQSPGVVSQISERTDLSDEPSPKFLEEEHTIRVPVKRPSLSPGIPRSVTAPLGGSMANEHDSVQTSLLRTRTIPTRHPGQRSPTPDGRQDSTRGNLDDAASPLRRMRSAQDLRETNRFRSSEASKNFDFAEVARESALSPASAASHRHPSPAGSDASANLPINSRSTELGASRFGSLSSKRGGSRQTLPPTLFDGSMGDGTAPLRDSQVTITRPMSPEVRGTGHISRASSQSIDDKPEGTSKGKWGFLKKMSISRLKSSDAVAAGIASGVKVRPALASVMSTPTVPRVGEDPELELEPKSHSANQSRSNSSLTVPQSGPSFTSLLVEETSRSPSSFTSLSPGASTSSAMMRRRSFLPIDPSPAIVLDSPTSIVVDTPISSHNSSMNRDSGSDASFVAAALTESRSPEQLEAERILRAKRTLMVYLQDMLDLNVMATSNPPASTPQSPADQWSPSRSRRPTLTNDGGPVRGMSDSSFSSIGSSAGQFSSIQLRSSQSTVSLKDAESGGSSGRASLYTTESEGLHVGPTMEERKSKSDKGRRTRIIREIVETERTYVKGLHELMDIYIKPASMTFNLLGGASRETVVPASERKIVFSGLDGLFHFHNENFLPALELAASPLLRSSSGPDKDPEGQLSSTVARAVANVFLSHAAFMKMYSSYINNFDSATQRLRVWTSKGSPSIGGMPPINTSPAGSTHLAAVGVGLATSGVATTSTSDAMIPGSTPNTLSTSQRKRIKTYLKRSRLHPRHSQLNLEGYLLLPVQRIPRYRLLLEELVRSTPSSASDGREDALDRALTEISSLAVNMNEGKRDSESRRKLVHWQSRIRGKFPSPLVQPHRRLIMDGPLHLSRVVRRSAVPFDILTSDGDTADVLVECLTPEDTPRELVGVLCNDLLVLCKDPSQGQNPTSNVDLWAVLRMQTLATPASVLSGNTLRVVDNKAILYFDAPSTSDALTWSRAINLHIPSSKL